jgi:hypothetical protein
MILVLGVWAFVRALLVNSAASAWRTSPCVINWPSCSDPSVAYLGGGPREPPADAGRGATSADNGRLRQLGLNAAYALTRYFRDIVRVATSRHRSVNVRALPRSLRASHRSARLAKTCIEYRHFCHSLTAGSSITRCPRRGGREYGAGSRRRSLARSDTPERGPRPRSGLDRSVHLRLVRHGPNEAKAHTHQTRRS